jgi:hypothetical protein
LIPLIKQDIEQGDRAGMQYYADAGDKLIEAKESGQVAFGYWGTWISKNFHLSDKQARIYMRAARLRAEHQNERGTFDLPSSLAEMTGDATRRRKRRDNEKPFRTVLQDLDTDIYTQEKQTRDEEVRLHREMALELVDIGYKALATRLHPDRGGSKDAMSRLNRVRDELKGIAETRRFV